ncbi:tellurite resistance/C4-dicarboxylate transporter family protein [Candidimonas humi]|uniref:Tellurite resistance/C4-dicarboxylate transporter family protein n=1 Tax=Candidimonas humi TaxID=683355 RepID=A0ABV8NR35_9BURK|nr:tellurite resistance/C4-dicarboxylate transporter family protein [Candidimonas humi]MBV6303779.1 tellurite resistance/C4-dicarboxylate transporter family protein [Candidimonas humi]
MSLPFFTRASAARLRRRRASKASLASMSPAYFGLAMATGIVSLAAHMLGTAAFALAPLFARILFHLNVVLYCSLWVLTFLRILRHPARVLDDLTHHLQGWGFFTVVAASSILGIQFLEQAGNIKLAWALWFLALGLWVCLNYVVFTALIIKTHKPELKQGINGGWLLAVVATQSISSLSLFLVADVPLEYRTLMAFLALSLWLWGGMLYIWMVSLIFYRDTFFRFSPGDMVPPYWINMGAMAISALTGASMIEQAADVPYLESLLPFVKGFTIFYWATGTWWIPLLVILEVWRHGFRHFPVQYDALYWGAVFPLGMYSASTYRMDLMMGFGFLMPVAEGFLYVAIVAWAMTFIGLLAWVGRRIFSRGQAGHNSTTARRHGIRHGLRTAAPHTRHELPTRHHEVGRAGHE